MNLGPSEVTDSDGAVVISITVARRWGQSPRTNCQHVRTHADEELAELHCLDCNEKLNPVWWIIRLADHWRHVEANRRAAIHEQERAQARTRMRCNCGKWVRFYSSTTDEKAREATTSPGTCRIRVSAEGDCEHLRFGAAGPYCALGTENTASRDRCTGWFNVAPASSKEDHK